MDLSLFEVTILELLQRHTKPVVRYSLYLEVNQYLQNEEYKAKFSGEDISKSEAEYLEFLKDHKRTSTSSFYNNLNNLESQKLISFVKMGKGKTVSVKSNKNTKRALDEIRTHFLRKSMTTDYKDFRVGASKALNAIGKKKFNSLLLIWWYGYADRVIFEYLNSISNHTFILCNEDLFKNSIKSNFPDFISSAIYEGLIREPNEIFDIVVYCSLDIDKSIIGISRENLIQESARITKKGGSIVLVNLRELPSVDNETTNDLIQKYNKANKYQLSNKKEFQKYFSSIGIENPEIIISNSLILGVGEI
jgi:DNA-binding PadR family transcriptional regulator